MSQELRDRLAQLNSEAQEMSDAWMRIGCREIQAVPSMQLAELGMIVGGQLDSVTALRQIADMGDDAANIICTAATAALMTECEVRRKAGTIVR